MWLRYVNIVLTPKDDPSRQQTFTSHRIDFVVRSTMGWGTDTAEVKLFNLSLDEVKFMQNRSYGDMYISIQAGYIDEMQANKPIKQRALSEGQSVAIVVGEQAPQTIFSGVITNVVGFKSPPEHITNLFCISKTAQVATTFTQMKALPPGITLGDAIRSMANDYGYTTVSTYGVGDDELQQVLPLGRTFHDTFLIEFQNLLGEYNLLCQLTTGEIQIYPETYGNLDSVSRMAKDRDPIRLDANSVIGNPIAGIQTFSVNTFLNSNVQPGMILDASPLLGKEILANGVVAVTNERDILNYDKSAFRWGVEDKYIIVDVVHHGSNRTNTFQTSLSCQTGGNSQMGGNELAWQEMYKASGMSEVGY